VNHRRIAAQKSNQECLMSERFPLPRKPEDFIPSLTERFNSKSLDAMLELYAPEAVFVAMDGRVITDRNEFGALFEHDMNLGPPLKMKVRHVFAGKDTAQIVLDWAIHGTDTEGRPVHVHGTAADIIRQGADGVWRCIIDNNQGTAVRRPD
jgi:uncharacterized protein (TIGR02246 family)